MQASASPCFNRVRPPLAPAHPHARLGAGSQGGSRATPHGAEWLRVAGRAARFETTAWAGGLDRGTGMDRLSDGWRSRACSIGPPPTPTPHDSSKNSERVHKEGLSRSTPLSLDVGQVTVDPGQSHL